MFTAETKKKHAEIAEKLRSRRNVDWKAVACRLKLIRERVPGNGSCSCSQDKWREIVYPDGKISTRTSLSNLERGETIPDGEDLVRYAAAGGVSLEWLLYGEEEKKAEKPTTLRDFVRVIADTWDTLELSLSEESVDVAPDNPNTYIHDFLTIKIPIRTIDKNNPPDFVNCNSFIVGTALLDIAAARENITNAQNERDPEISNAYYNIYFKTLHNILYGNEHIPSNKTGVPDVVEIRDNDGEELDIPYAAPKGKYGAVVVAPYWEYLKMSESQREKYIEHIKKDYYTPNDDK